MSWNNSVVVISGYIESTLFSGAVADDNTAVYEVFREHFDQLVMAMGTSPTALIPVLYSKGVVSRTQLEMNPSPGTGEECSCDQWLY